MPCNNDSLAEYIEDLPMRLSRRFEPLRVELLSEQLPSVPSLREAEFHYGFDEERMAIQAAQNRDFEICQEAQTVRIRWQQQQQQQQEQRINHSIQFNQMNHHSNQPTTVTTSTSASTSSLTTHPPLSASSLTPVSNTSLASSASDTVPILTATSVAPITIVPSEATTATATTTTTTSRSFESQLPTPVHPTVQQLPPVPNHIFPTLNPVLSAESFSTTIKSEANASTANNSTTSTTATATAAAANANSQQPKINPREFEIFDSSPFDDALLRSIDDRQELTLIFGGGGGTSAGASTVHR